MMLVRDAMRFMGGHRSHGADSSLYVTNHVRDATSMCRALLRA
jgi:hypothetical protein